jgi:hypothetical protein
LIPDIEQFLPVAIFKMYHKKLWWPFWKWRPVEIVQCRESIRDILIYPHVKLRWNRAMLNLCGIVVAILKMATGRNFSMSAQIDSQHWTITTGRYFQNGHHNTPKIQHCPISSKFDMWVDNDVLNWFLTLKNFYQSPTS